MMHPAKPKKMVGTFKVSSSSIRSFVLGLSGNFSLYFFRSIGILSFCKRNKIHGQRFCCSDFLDDWQLNLDLLF